MKVKPAHNNYSVNDSFPIHSTFLQNQSLEILHEKLTEFSRITSND